MFYNVENLYDTEDDPLTNDEEFLPDGTRYWTPYRLKEKLNNIYKVITAIGGWDLPTIVCFAEVENRKVLEMLLSNTPLNKSDYKIIHYDSPDARGVDVAMIYRNEKFTPYFHKPIPINFSADVGSGKTRDVLLVSGVTKTHDTLHIFVNHWPSRWGGQMETEEKRMFVAKVVRKNVDSIMKINPEAKIIITGDLNDYPTDRSLTVSLNAKTQFEKINDKDLYNLSYYLQEVKHKGTHKYEGQWGVLDQIIVSGVILNKNKKLFTTLEDIHVFEAPFILEPDEKYTGYKPKRTYIGFKYNNGFSDHLPVFFDLIIND